MSKIKILLYLIIIFAVYKGYEAFRDFEIGVGDRVAKIEELAGFEKEDEVIGKVYDSYIEFKNNVTEYHKISEDSFIEARNK